ncbi:MULTISPECIES: COX15/CtaA family protein [unclassified Mucilaginibacter]|uniref:COX15/CtaA family protein n=1 Tax=unclassified Mucilaginibacter TaxID=2617802 RepID=UPI002AC9BD76|nr:MULTISPECIES: COX15/CtaA family protein [unclassified Mucilaginibacter]MEB0249575.1 COX15/CtaA family protein [Mucilaginibacter sp. 5B2]MEB0263961.1 COX15/CtaA family protein [Mucilaginibacter sp. 10I4]MEB0280131.1 COX15/CtaA family protein [Mucilaginibacter sp. 10B2]MEB0303139.1 COX15/CtaA family protein [Mucilaginibacter sp. 5C4]WPX24460.1 COX15/CtaA family protein [Mucilaginibacter sp. 5C4]
MSIKAPGNKFLKFNLITIILLFLVILAGGVVRSTGSGMGCPDWPKCFGRYIPPTSISELPANYKKSYSDKRLAKNQKFAKMLDIFGYSQLAMRIRNDKSILVPEEFNTARTWTEYINRLIGAASGLFLLLCVVYSFKYWKTNKPIVFLSIFNVFLVAFQAWLGSIVVSTNLVAWIVTVHMLIALVILAISITTYHMAKVQGRYKVERKPFIAIVTLLVLALSVLQITFGTELREKIDAVASHLEGSYRASWVHRAGDIFAQHRDVALIVLIMNVVLYALIRKGFNKHSVQQQLMSFTFLMIMLQIVTGILLSYWALPPFAQAVHIVLASLVFGAQFYLLLNLFSSVNVQGAGK